MTNERTAAPRFSSGDEAIWITGEKMTAHARDMQLRRRGTCYMGGLSQGTEEMCILYHAVKHKSEVFSPERIR